MSPSDCVSFPSGSSSKYVCGRGEINSLEGGIKTHHLRFGICLRGKTAANYQEAENLENDIDATQPTINFGGKTIKPPSRHRLS